MSTDEGVILFFAGLFFGIFGTSFYYKTKMNSLIGDHSPVSIDQYEIVLRDGDECWFQRRPHKFKIDLNWVDCDKVKNTVSIPRWLAEKEGVVPRRGRLPLWVAQ